VQTEALESLSLKHSSEVNDTSSHSFAFNKGAHMNAVRRKEFEKFKAQGMKPKDAYEAVKALKLKGHRKPKTVKKVIKLKTAPIIERVMTAVYKRFQS